MKTYKFSAKCSCCGKEFPVLIFKAKNFLKAEEKVGRMIKRISQKTGETDISRILKDTRLEEVLRYE